MGITRLLCSILYPSSYFVLGVTATLVYCGECVDIKTTFVRNCNVQVLQHGTLSQSTICSETQDWDFLILILFKLG